MELFRERGYARTTVEDIAARAGLTERTFFRYFADKREVLFAGSQELETRLAQAIAAAPAGLAPLDVVLTAFTAAGAHLEEVRALSHVRARHALLSQHAELRERELIKLAALGSVVGEALRARGVAEPAASMAAEAGVAAFKVGFERWVTSKKRHSFADQIRAALHALTQLAASADCSGAREGQRRP